MACRSVKGRFIKSGEKRKLCNLKVGSNKRVLVDIEPEIEPDLTNEIRWHEGRRVVDLGYLAKCLEKCSFPECSVRLNLQNIETETRIGLGSILWVRCDSCGELNKIYTNKTHEQKGRGRPVFDVNTKLATALIHAGLSVVSVQRLLECLEIPPPSRTCFKAREREVGPSFEKIATESCKNALDLETSLSVSDCSEKPVGITASFDMGWQRRSSGRLYNSKSGVGALIGKETGKLIAYNSRVSNCKQCEVNEKNGTQKDHDCRLNWLGSAKSMEADVAVELVKEVESSKCRVSTIIGDDDATTINKIEKNIDYPIVKLSDFNHSKKSVANDLYSLQKKFKILQPKVIRYLTDCFSYAISQNKGDCIGVQKSLVNITPHVFGEHDECGPWCKKKNNPNIRYNSLPYGKPLEGVELREAINSVFLKHAKHSARLCYKSSSNANESFNRTIAGKAPKSNHFSKSESLDYRISSAVCQKNMGEKYVNLINKDIGLSPGKVVGKGVKRRDSIMQKKKHVASTVVAKKRRRELKSLRNSTLAQREVREGVTYQTSIGLTNLNDLETTSIPAPSPLPEAQKLSAFSLSSSSICVFDLETTSLYDDCDLVQISAKILGEECSFNCYILPDAPISPAASRITALSKKGNKLFYHGKEVSSVSIKTGLRMFSEWLSSIKTEIVLVGHNIKSFDVKHFMRHVKNQKMDSNFHMIIGYVDTLPIFKSLFPKHKSYSQTSLYTTLVGGKYIAHNAFNDVQALCSLLALPSITFDILSDFSMTSSWILKYCDFLYNKKISIASFHALLQNKVLSKGMIEKAAISGLRFEHLHIVFTRAGETGLRSLLSEVFNGKVRVTKSSNIHLSLINYFKCLNEKT